jgi:hypothetical protein
MLYAPRRLGVSERSSRSRSGGGPERILGRLAAVVRAAQIVLQGWPEPALDQYRLPHRPLGPLTVREMMMFSVYHHPHHLRRVAERSRDSSVQPSGVQTSLEHRP